MEYVIWTAQLRHRRVDLTQRNDPAVRSFAAQGRRPRVDHRRQIRQIGCTASGFVARFRLHALASARLPGLWLHRGPSDRFLRLRIQRLRSHLYP